MREGIRRRGRERGDGGVARQADSPQKGAALIVTVLALMLLSATGAALVLLTGTDLLIAENAAASSEAFYAADAVFERTIAELQEVPDFTTVLGGLVESAFEDGTDGRTCVARHPGGPGRPPQPRKLRPRRRLQRCRHYGRHRDRPWGAMNPRWRIFSSGPLASADGSPWSGFPLYAVSLVADGPAGTIQIRAWPARAARTRDRTSCASGAKRSPPGQYVARTSVRLATLGRRGGRPHVVSWRTWSPP